VNSLMFALVMITTLQQIINAAWHKAIQSVEKLARWIRCLITLAVTSNVEMAEQLLDQVESIVQESRKVCNILCTWLDSTNMIIPISKVFSIHPRNLSGLRLPHSTAQSTFTAHHRMHRAENGR